MSAKFNFDILCVSYKRPEVFKGLLDYLSNSDQLEQLNHLIVIVHSFDKETIELIETYRDSLKVKLLEFDTTLGPSKSRNTLIKNSDADYFLFLDDDIVPSDNYFTESHKIISEFDPDVFGGPDQAQIKGGQKQEIVSSLMTSPFVTGGTFKRHCKTQNQDLDATELQLTLCNLWIKRESVKEIDTFFDEKIKRAEECDLLNRISQLNLRVGYFPNLYVYHLRREKLIDLFKIHLIAGEARSSIIIKDKKNFHYFFIIPFLTAILIPILAIYDFQSLLMLSLTHLVISFLVIKKLNIAKKVNEFMYSYLVIVVIHLGFSLGMFSGIITRDE